MIDFGSGDEEDEFGLKILGGLFGKKGADEGKVADGGSGVFDLLLLVGDEASEKDGFSAGEGDFFIEAALFENGLKVA